jgi:hypothetical protein
MDFGWSPVAQQLAEDEYYVLVITFLHRDSHRYPDLQVSTKDTRWAGQLHRFLYDDPVLADRSWGWQHGWYVVVMRNPGTNEKGEITGTEVSPRSAGRSFNWKLEPTEVPTKTPIPEPSKTAIPDTPAPEPSKTPIP